VLAGVFAPAGGAYWHEQSELALVERAGKGPLVLRLETTQSRNPAGDLLAYAYLPDASLLNLELIRFGQAYADRRSAFAQRPQFEQAENEARQKKRGLWRAVTEEQMPVWRQDWLRKRRQKRLQHTHDACDPADRRQIALPEPAAAAAL
jgi:endonuclease YncB( thermonuclease family)